MVKLFCYGSLNSQMIESLIGERLPKNPVPGILSNHIRVFADYSPYWGGAVASVYPLKHHNVYGAIVDLTDAQMRHIDEYEGDWYVKVKRKITLKSGKHTYAYLYEKKDTQYTKPPSSRYLESIRTTLRGVGWTQEDDPIKVYAVFTVDGKSVPALVL